MGYRRIGWPLKAAEFPVVGIYLEWKKGPATFADGRPRYFGVSVDLNNLLGAVLSETIAAGIGGSQTEFPNSSGFVAGLHLYQA